MQLDYAVDPHLVCFRMLYGIQSNELAARVCLRMRYIPLWHPMVIFFNFENDDKP